MIRAPRFAALVWLGVVTMSSATAYAEADARRARTASLAWLRLPGAEDCIDMRALAQAVEGRLRRPAFVSPTSGDLAIEGRIAPVSPEGGWRATVIVADPTGLRVGVRELQIDKASCRAIDDELELVLALLIDADSALSPPVAPTPPVVAPPVMTLPATHCPPESPPPVRRWHLGMESGAIAGIGVLPSPVGAGLEVLARVALARGPSFELGGSIWLDSHVRTPHGEPAFSLAYASVAACPFGIEAHGSAISACLGAQIGSLRVGAAALPSLYRQEQLVFNLATEVRLRHRFVGPLLGSVGLEVAVPIVRDKFYSTDAEGVRHDVFQASPVAGLLNFGLGVELP